MKRFIAILLAALMIFALAACGSAQEDPPAADVPANDAPASNDDTPENEPRKIVIGFAMNTMDENMNRNLKGLQKAAEDINAARDDIEVEIIFSDGQGSVEKQLSDVETMVLQKPDAIILSAVDTSGSIPAAQVIRDAGILCIEKNGIDTQYIDCFFQGTDEPASSAMIASWYEEQLNKDPDLVLNAVLIYGRASQTVQLARHIAIKELAEKYPDRVKILDENYADWSTDMAQKLVEDWLQLYGDELNCICSASDDMSLGAVNALKAAGYNPGDIFISSVDGTKIGMQLVEEGWIQIDIKSLMMKRGEEMVNLALMMLEGEYSENVYNAGKKCVAVVTADNVAEMKDAD